MSVLRSIAMAFSLFTVFPIPHVTWDKKSLRYMLAFFPLVGLVVGILLVAWLNLCAALQVSKLLTAVGVCIIPVLLTGGIHLDGFCDTVDALASHADSIRKREILKDPHAGAFAVIFVCVYFLAYFGFATQINYSMEAVVVLGLIPILSRCQSGLASLIFPEPNDVSEGLTHTFRASSDKRYAIVALCMFYAVCTAVLLLVNLPIGLGVVGAGLLCAAYTYSMSRRQFGGMSGDLAGYYLQLVELASCISVVIVQGVMSL